MRRCQCFLPPHVAKLCGRRQLSMLSLEHCTLIGHPDGIAFGSQSCASFGPVGHAIMHAEVVWSFMMCAQHTLPIGQSVVFAHLKAFWDVEHVPSVHVDPF